jgi:hypothetical protein
VRPTSTYWNVKPLNDVLMHIKLPIHGLTVVGSKVVLVLSPVVGSKIVLVLSHAKQAQQHERSGLLITDRLYELLWY